MAYSKTKEIEKEWTIPAQGEFRFEISFDQKISIQLISGKAEIFGTELAPNKEYELSGVKFAVYSHEGAKLFVKGECEVEYISEETPMASYLNAFFALETLRCAAAEVQDSPPRILFIGESRHTVARIFLNYSVRRGKTPVYGSLLFPGVIAAQTIDKTVDIEDGFPEGQICSYYFGHRNASDNSKMYQKLLGRLAFAVNGRLASMNDEHKSGAFIVAPSDVEPFLSSIRDLFQINVIFVIGSERLHSTIVKSFANISMDLSVLKLSLSGGFVKLDSSFRKAEFQKQIRSYFYGKRDEYTPFSNTRSYETIKMYRLGEDALAPSSALPLGASRKVSETRTVKIEPTQAIMLYSILAISWASNEDQLSDVNCAGYIYVTMADDDKKTFTYLCPSPGDLPSPYLVIGDIKWIEK